MEINQESVVLLADPGAGTMHGTQKLRGASLLEYFTPEQIRTHINSPRQFVGPTKSKAEQRQAMQNSSNQSRCQLCCMENLSFALAVYCNLCGLHVKRDAIYYITSNGGKQSYICPRCFRGARGESIEVEGFQVFKSNFVEKKNIDELNEEWVQCSGCGSWNHQICALFNNRSYSGQTEYVCPYCFLQEVEGGKRNPLPQSDLHSAKDLPMTILSDQLEQRLLRRLNWEREERAKVSGKNFDEVPGAKDLVIRVFLSVDKKLLVSQRFLEIVKDESYSSEFPYKSKVILLFQKIEGVDVVFFACTSKNMVRNVHIQTIVVSVFHILILSSTSSLRLSLLLGRLFVLLYIEKFCLEIPFVRRGRILLWFTCSMHESTVVNLKYPASSGFACCVKFFIFVRIVMRPNKMLIARIKFPVTEGESIPFLLAYIVSH
ncbi:histone acetyltransferase HAC1 [Amborella trichopoda]|uniref:histone acetyltransferase HAC1 n=1 Tax=Amborella trichopoda TaxID=13333 RepID=UPI0009BDD814|nr:histone acetyltransferase HAC1 [Amborella trichopoda]|eukprot:XP_020525743.1 histone acetyltransferase HAC1 [Amborella trichopoda]